MLLAALATFAGALLQSATGFGFALLAAPALLLVLSPGETIAALLVMGALLSSLVLFGERRPRAVRRGDVVPLVVAAIPGLVLGLLILRAIPKAALQVVVGVGVVAAVGVQVRALRVRARAREGAQARVESGGRRRETAAVGLLTGALTTSTGLSGPPLVLLLEARGATPAEMRDTLAATFLAFNLLGLAALPVLVPDATLGQALAVVGLLALVAVGHAAGRRVFARLDAARYRPVVAAVAVAAGVASIVAGLSG